MFKMVLAALLGALIQIPPAQAADNAVNNKAPPDKTAVVIGVQKILETEQGIRTKMDAHFTDQLKAMQSVNGGSMNANLLETELLRKESKVEEDQNLLIENHLRIEFLNDFISALEASSDPRTDSTKILLDLAHKDLLANIESHGDSKTWLFDIYLSIAIRDIMEPSENFGDFVKNYIVYSSLKEPKSPAEFMKTRAYIGGNNNNSTTTKKDDKDSMDERTLQSLQPCQSNQQNSSPKSCINLFK